MAQDIGVTANSDVSLPFDITSIICSYVSKPDQHRLRLVSRKLRDAATPHAFRSLYLRAYGDSPSNFGNIARSPALRNYVREVTIDTWIGPGYEYNADESYDVPHDFLNTLPYLRYYQKMTRLHLRFSKYCGIEDYHTRSVGPDIEETWSLRYKILDTVAHCVMGMWTKESQMKISQRVGNYQLRRFAWYEDDLPDLRPGIVMNIKELTISNLADYKDPNLLESIAWKKLLHLPTLIDLKVLVTKEHTMTESADIFCDEKYEFFQNLHFDLLTPPVASKLQVLSLFYVDFWGWIPKMDLALIGPMPQLKILALGNYVFTNESQIDWIASLGNDNRSSGLEELYLNDCPVLYEARQHGPLTIDGYPIPDKVMEAFRAQPWAPSTTKYSIRWYQILNKWQKRMRGLRKFVMGHGNWQSASLTINASNGREEYAHLNYDEKEQRFLHNSHRYFACPEPQPQELRRKAKIVPADKYLYGAGLSQRRTERMEYIYYDIGQGPSPWEYANIHWDRWEKDAGCAPEDETVAMDDAAYDMLMATIQDRLKC
ncbi:hypothetical protein FHETE_1172 [Fusarium heterosporum]|uniref:F-box domain-containing protein n=1 Tax=Fusarium heterosporum TaxID=42747 RepID=A0A8H5X1A3_FUSHE|nr:hypothetical protein FHETE_1172 [Fusarium heterosporum]